MEEIIKERLELARLRIGQIKEEEKAPFWSSFFEETALHLEKLFSLAEGLPAFQEAKMMWESLWKYNPKEDREQTDSVERFHKLKLLLIREFQVLISEAYRGRTEILLLYGELFLQLFGAVQELHAFPEKLYRELRELIYWFYFDNCEELCACFGEAVFRDKKERERVLNLNRLDSDYLYQSGARLDGSARARAVYYGLCSLDQLEKEAKEVLAVSYTHLTLPTILLV